MCQMYRKTCSCGQRTGEIFFGNMLLDEASVVDLYCPQCSATVETNPVSMVEDNGWVLELDADILKVYSPRMQLDADSVNAAQVFDAGYVTWVGFSPEDNQNRSSEREQIMKETEGNKGAQFTAIKQWAIDREKKFVTEGWRKALKGQVAA
jgi:hypothetical protein